MCVCVCIVGGVGITGQVRVNNKEEPGRLILHRLDLAKFTDHASILQDYLIKPTIFKKHLSFKG